MLANKHACKQTCLQTNMLANKHACKQTCLQTNFLKKPGRVKRNYFFKNDQKCSFTVCICSFETLISSLTGPRYSIWLSSDLDLTYLLLFTDRHPSVHCESVIVIESINILSFYFVSYWFDNLIMKI
jgi:hypothetical protein